MDFRILYSRFENLQARKSARQSLMSRASEFFEPHDLVLSGLQNVESTTGERAREFVDTTAIEVIDEYVTNVFGITYNPNKRWFRIEHTDIDIESDEQKVLDRRAEIVFRQIGRSNYYTQIDRHERDVAGYGHGLFIINGDKETFAKCYAKNPFGVIFKSDIYGEVYEKYWVNSYSFDELIEEHPSLLQYMDMDKYDEYLNSDSVHPDFSVLTCIVPLRKPYITSEKDKEMEKKKFKWMQKFIFRDTSGLFNQDAGKPDKDGYYGELAETEYFKSRNAFPARDKPSRDQPYGLGIYRDILPQARILNNLKAGMIEMANFQARPPAVMTAEVFQKSGGAINPDQIFVRNTSKNGIEDRQPAVELLQLKGDLASVDAIHKRQQEQLVERLPTSSNIYKVARQSVDEIQQRMQQQEKKIAPLRANYLKEATTRHLRKFYELCEKQGMFNKPELKLPEGTSKSIKIGANSPKIIFDGFLLQKHRETRATAMYNAIAASNIVAAWSPQSLGMIDGDVCVKTFFAAAGVMDAIKSDQRIADERQDQLDVAERQQNREDGKVAAENARAVGSIGELLQRASQGAQ